MMSRCGRSCRRGDDLGGSDAMECFENFAGGIVQGDGSSVGATHGAIGLGERAQHPLHFAGIETRVDLDGGAAGDGGADVAAKIVEGCGAQFGLGDLENFIDDLFEIGWADGSGRGFYGDGAVAEGFGFKAGGVQLIGDAGVIDLLLGGQGKNERHQQALHLDPAGGALLHYLLEKDALMGYMLIDDPQTVAAGGEDEAFMDLA